MSLGRHDHVRNSKRKEVRGTQFDNAHAASIPRHIKNVLALENKFCVLNIIATNRKSRLYGGTGKAP